MKELPWVFDLLTNASLGASGRIDVSGPVSAYSESTINQRVPRIRVAITHKA